MIKRVNMIGMLGTRVAFAMKKTGKASLKEECNHVPPAAFAIGTISAIWNPLLCGNTSQHFQQRPFISRRHLAWR
jgi:hypothetical protein